MSATAYPAPIFDKNNFELESRKTEFDKLIPAHFNWTPSTEERSMSLWAVEGLEEPGNEDSRTLLAANIGDITIVNAAGKEQVITGEAIAGMLVSARFGKLTQEHPDLEEPLEHDTALIRIPEHSLLPLYERGMYVAEGMDLAIADRVLPSQLGSIAEAMKDGADYSSVIGRIAGRGANIQTAPLPVAVAA